jgi:arsenite methyltransferase
LLRRYWIVEDTSVRDGVKEYYGSTLQSSADLKTNACCTGDKPPPYVQDCLKNIHPTILSKYYGCGLCLPDYDLTGLSVLDLGCGAGRDVYLASQLVGPDGKVVGVDMTEAQLDTAREYQDYHAEKFGFANVNFVQGYLEQLDDIEALQPSTFDVIISNCVLNLCTDKLAVLNSCYKLLKAGGEMYFSDVYATRRVPEILRQDPILWGECLSGALYWNDFMSMAKRAGFTDVRLVEDAPITISNAKVAQAIADSGHGNIRFVSATYRLYKIDELEPDCEDYGQAVAYKGTIPRAKTSWRLDKKHVFETGKVVSVCGNTLLMLQTGPLKDHFAFHGTFDTHYGIFEGCGSSGMPFITETTMEQAKENAASCC